MASFLLTEEPWIPIVRLDGRPAELSLRDTFTQATEIREISDPSPLVTVALHRLLLAILHRNIGPSNIAAWQALWQAGRFDTMALDQYLMAHESNFDLFHPVRPFYQTADLADANPLPIGQLIQEAASGNNPTLFDHSFSAQGRRLSPGASARGLIALQAFALGGGVSRPFNFSDASLTRGYTVMMIGANLFETLLFNLLVYAGDQPIPRAGEDLPVWEQTTTREPDRAGTVPLGYLDYLTFQSRRVQLIRDTDGWVSGCRILQGFRLPDDGVLDPGKAYRRDDQKRLRPVLLSPDRALWRDSHTLFEEAGPDLRDTASKRPEVFRQMGRLYSDRIFRRDQQYSFAALGLATEPGQNLVHLWRHERLPLPLAYLAERPLRAKLDEALRQTEETAQVLRMACYALARHLLASGPDSSEPDRRTAGQLADSFHPGLRYWPRLEEPFRQFLVDLAADRIDNTDGVIYGGQVLPAWVETLRQTARTAFNEIARGAGDTGRAFKARALAATRFEQLLAGSLGSRAEGGAA